ncbi:helix-turn-helix domain-containing protein [Pediococcus pentosaceus]|uniref:helix-turn-helix domain-containing protein n=1 Tax=Pediococcus pentosaceus TaxID=1255 RepID=UPI003981F292
MIKYELSPQLRERAKVIKANLVRSELSTQDLAIHFGFSRSHIQDVLKGRYSEETTDERFTEFETYLSAVLGVRYIQPYLNDLPQLQVDK